MIYEAIMSCFFFSLLSFFSLHCYALTTLPSLPHPQISLLDLVLSFPAHAECTTCEQDAVVRLRSRSFKQGVGWAFSCFLFPHSAVLYVHAGNSHSLLCLFFPLSGISVEMTLALALISYFLLSLSSLLFLCSSQKRRRVAGRLAFVPLRFWLACVQAGDLRAKRALRREGKCGVFFRYCCRCCEARLRSVA